MEKGEQHRQFLAALDRWKDESGAHDEDRVRVAAKQVRELMAQPGWLVIQELVSAVHRANEHRLVHKAGMSHEEMTRAAGTLVGLEAIQGAAEAVLIRDRENEEKRQAQASREAAAERR